MSVVVETIFAGQTSERRLLRFLREDIAHCKIKGWKTFFSCRRVGTKGVESMAKEHGKGMQSWRNALSNDTKTDSTSTTINLALLMPHSFAALETKGGEYDLRYHDLSNGKPCGFVATTRQ